MNYISTRDKTVIKTGAQAILQGISEEGGLFVPQEIPQITENFINGLVDITYPRRAASVMRLFLTDFEPAQVFGCAAFAYEGTFEGNNPAPIVQLGDSNACMLELWHGPTLAFKDMALQILPQLMKTAREIENDTRIAVVLVATSGDTGKAALEGFAGVQGTKIIVYYPNGGVSPMQRLQMVSQRGENVLVQAVDGNFDNCQSGVKKIFSDTELAQKASVKGCYFTSANSINWGRLLPQIVYYFSAYADMLGSGKISSGEAINVSVPTGNFGDILAAYYAKKMGLPIAKLICASNKNDVLTEFINTGVYNKKRDFYTTNTPSMDILVSSNLERLLFNILGEDDKAVTNCMNMLAERGEYTVDADILERIKGDFSAYSSDEAAIIKTIGDIKRKYDYTCDPHTAVAVDAFEKYVAETGDMTKTLIVSTASPFKFSSTVLEALGCKLSDNDDEFERLDILAKASGLNVPEALSKLIDAPIRFGGSCHVDAMGEKLMQFVKA